MITQTAAQGGEPDGGKKDKKEGKKENRAKEGVGVSDGGWRRNGEDETRGSENGRRGWRVKTSKDLTEM